MHAAISLNSFAIQCTERKAAQRKMLEWLHLVEETNNWRFLHNSLDRISYPQEGDRLKIYYSLTPVIISDLSRKSSMGGECVSSLHKEKCDVMKA